MPSVAQATLNVAAVTGTGVVLNVGSADATPAGAILEVESSDDGYTAAMARASRSALGRGFQF